MLKLNNTIINSKHKCTNFIKLNEISNIEDNENQIEIYYKINYNINDKVSFLNVLRNYLHKKDTFILFINSNNINELFDIIRLEKFIKYVTNNNKDRVSDEYLLLRYGFINKKDREKRSISKETYIKKYGEELGILKYNANIKKQKDVSKRSLKYWINLYNDKHIAKQKLKEYQQSHIKTHFNNKSDEYIEQYNKKNSPWNVEFYLNKGFNFGTIVSTDAYVSKDAEIGKGSFIAPGVKIISNAIISSCCSINTGAIIEHDTFLQSNVQISPGSIICGGVTIGENTFIGAGSIIRDGLSIANNSIIGMGSVVTRSIDISGVYYGNPLKRLTH